MKEICVMPPGAESAAAAAVLAEGRAAGRGPSHGIGLTGRRRLAQALFSAGGALASYPGPAAAIGAGGLVLAANPAAEKLLDALFARRSGELRPAIDAALAGVPAQLPPLLLPGNGPEPLAIELMVLPYRAAHAALLLGRDVTESRSKDAELARLRHRERLLAYLVRTIRYEVDPRSAAMAASVAALPALAAEGCRVHRMEADGSLTIATECGTPAPAAEAEALAALAAGESRFEREVDGRAVIAVPIRHGRRLSGAVVLWRPLALGQWDSDDRFLVAELAGQLEVVLQQMASQETLATLSRTDPLTGLVNRRSFVDELETRLAQGGRGKRGALLYIDLDNFKPVNDRLGHAEGDAALVAFARLLRDCTRSSDLVARLGGDEFVAWLEDIDETAAAAKAHDILRRVEQDLRPRSAAGAPPLGASIGIALVPPAQPEDADGLIARADTAMYRAKRGGKQRFAVAGPAAATALPDS